MSGTRLQVTHRFELYLHFAGTGVALTDIMVEAQSLARRAEREEFNPAPFASCLVRTRQ